MVCRRTVLALPFALWAGAGLHNVAWARQAQDTLSIGLSLPPDSLDPSSAPAAVIGEVVYGSIFQGLTKVLESGQVVAQLAQKWQVSADGLDYHFYLKPGIKYQDGSDFNAACVVFSIERAKALDTRNKLADTFANVNKVQALNEHEVLIRLDRAQPFFLHRLAEPPAVMLHPHSAAAAATRPVGTGPYSLDCWCADGSIRLLRWDGHPAAKNVAIRAVDFRFIPDAAEQIQQILDGRLDLLFRTTSYNIPEALSGDKYQIINGSSSGKGMLAINNRRKPLDNVLVRRALTHAIDRVAFIHKVMNGMGSPIGSHFVPTDPNFINLASMYSYDPARAQELLAQADVQTPLRLVLSLPPTPYALSGGPVIRDYLAAIGVELELKMLSWQAWLDTVFKGDFDLSLIVHVESLDFPIYVNPDYYFGYDSQSFRSLVRQHAQSSNPRTRARLFMDIQRHLAQDAVNVWIFNPYVSSVIREGLKGLPMDYPLYVHDLAALYWD